MQQALTGCGLLQTPLVGPGQLLANYGHPRLAMASYWPAMAGYGLC